MANERDKGTVRGGFFGGLRTLVDSLSELMSRLPERDGEVRQEGELPLEGLDSRLKAVYGFSLRVGGPGAKTTVEPFGNVTRGKQGEPVVSEYREPLLDVFEEDRHIVVVAELPGIKESEVSTELNGDVLIIKADGSRNKFYKELLLSETPKKLASSYLNGILEVRLARGASKERKPPAASPKNKTGNASRKAGSR